MSGNITGPSAHTFYVDMNALRNDDTVGTLLQHANDPLPAQVFPPEVGEVVTVSTEDGDEWYATVTRRHGQWLEVRMLWDRRPWLVKSEPG